MAKRFALSFSFGGALTECECSVLVRSFGRKPLCFSIAYIPLFPQLDGNAVTQASAEFSALLSDIADALKAFLPSDTLCVRFDPDVIFDTPEERDSAVQQLTIDRKNKKRAPIKNAVDIQPPDSTRIDLTRTEDEILSTMKSKWRYNIRLASRKGVTVTRTDGADADCAAHLDDFYALYQTTALRDGIAIHAKSYYADLLQKSSAALASGIDAPHLSLYTAMHDGEALAAIITLFSKSEAIYLYGCSGNRKRNLMPAYLLQWTAFCDAKKYGSPVYDMYGMPPAADEKHPMYGLYLFKTGFGGKNIHRLGTFDVSVSRFYPVYAVAEKLRAFIYKKLLKHVAGR